MYEDYRTFKMVRVFGRKPGQLVAVTLAYDAAKFGPLSNGELPDASGVARPLFQPFHLSCMNPDRTVEISAYPMIAIRFHQGRLATAITRRDWTKPQLPFRHCHGGMGFWVRHRPTFFDLAQFSKEFNLSCLSFGR